MTSGEQSGRGAILGANSPNRLGVSPLFSLSTDHRHIGAMYLVFAAAAGLIGTSPSLMARADVPAIGALAPGYGTVIAFFAFIPALMGGFGSWFVPLMVGANDMAFPRMHNIAFWLLALSFTLFLASLFVTGDSVYMAHSQMGASPAMPWALLSIYSACASSILLAINFITTIFNMRAPRVTLHGMPILVWSMLVAAILLLLWPPVVASAVMLLSTNAHSGIELVASADGSNPRALLLLLHPELYILILLSFGIVSEIVCTSSKKPAFAYRATACAMVAIGLIGFFVWAQRVYAGASDSYSVVVAVVVAASTSTMIVSWLAATLRRGVSFQTPVLWAAGFIFLIAAGGTISIVQTGAGVASSPQDVQSALVDFQDVLFVGAVFAIFAGCYYWFPKITGLLYNEALGKLHFWITFIGVNLVFVTQHLPSPAGMLRPYVNFQEADASWHQATAVGGDITIAGAAIFLVCMTEALIRKQLANQNPWKAITPEWTSSSAPLFHGFVTLSRARLLVLVALVTISVLLTALLAPGLREPPLLLARLVRENPSPVPDVAFTDLAGKAHRLSDFRGRFVLFNLWATWCAPCVREVPALAWLSVAMPRQRFVIVAVALPPGSAKETHRFLSEYEASALPTYFDSQMTSFNVFHAYGLPLTVLIDPHGQEIARAQGPVEWAAPETVESLKTLSGIR